MSATTISIFSHTLKASLTLILNHIIITLRCSTLASLQFLSLNPASITWTNNRHSNPLFSFLQFNKCLTIKQYPNRKSIMILTLQINQIKFTQTLIHMKNRILAITVNLNIKTQTHKILKQQQTTKNKSSTKSSTETLSKVFHSFMK